MIRLTLWRQHCFFSNLISCIDKFKLVPRSQAATTFHQYNANAKTIISPTKFQNLSKFGDRFSDAKTDSDLFKNCLRHGTPQFDSIVIPKPSSPTRPQDAFRFAQEASERPLNWLKTPKTQNIGRDVGNSQKHRRNKWKDGESAHPSSKMETSMGGGNACPITFGRP